MYALGTLGAGVKRPERKADGSLPSFEINNNEFSYGSISPPPTIAFVILLYFN